MSERPIWVSHSSMQAWNSCTEKYYLRYVERLESIEKGSALSFGSAMDNAINYCLAAHQKSDFENLATRAYEVFLTDQTIGWQQIFDNPNVRFLDSDFDYEFFASEDLEELSKWEEELGVNVSDAYDSFKARKTQKQSEAQAKLTNRVCWKSLAVRAKYCLEELVNNVFPQIEEVLLFQHEIKGSIPLPSYGDGSQAANSIGYLDAVLRLKGYDKPIVMDFKTSSSPYDDDAVFKSQQLALYMTPTGQEFNTDLAGYVVLHKKLSVKSASCSNCGHEKTSQARSCDNVLKGDRCKGAWTKEFKATSQILVDKILETRQNQIMTSYVNFAQVAGLNIRIQNWNACKEYGFFCDFYELCHFGDSSKVKNKEKRKKEI